jgi:hypothetical protein
MDIKPVNVLVNSVTGKVWLMGFGNGRTLWRSALTGQGTAVQRQRIGKYPQITQITQIFCFSFFAYRGHCSLWAKWDSAIANFKFESLLIDRFEKTATEFYVNLESRPDELIGLIVHRRRS